MKYWGRVLPVVLLAGVAFLAACTPPSGGGGGTTTTTISNLTPVASASAGVTSGNVPLSVAFDASDSVDADGTIVGYAWDFGNSTTGSGLTASTTYTSGGVFTVILMVTDNLGATDTDSITITVNGDGDGDGYFPPADCNDAAAGINPGAADPAGDNIDQNCDGIDGEQNDATFVNSNTGANTSTCGTILEPCASISQGQIRAGALSKANVFVAGGTYAKFTVQDGLAIRGGYGQNWQRGVQASGSTVANVTASFDASVGGPVAVIADDILTPTQVVDLRLTGGAASAGQTSYTMIVRNSTNALLLDSLTIIGGTAGSGANGAPGSTGWFVPAGSGGNGGNGFEPGGCNTSAAGSGGPAGSGSNSGGIGGKGGAIDGSCFLGVCSSCNAKPGNAGTAGAGAGAGGGGAGGPAGTSGIPGVCNIQNNRATDGTGGGSGGPGSAGSSGSGGPAGAAGGTGGLGTAGAGGGAGGGGGGADCGTDDAGAGGGGGGGGGAGAASGGAGGAAGASSVAVRLENSSPVLSGVQITLGTGGVGGIGGAGAAGQPGGASGAGGAPFERGGAGGAGGAGGTGGASGVGGGGGGGAAIGLSRNSGSAPSGTPSYSGGAGGSGGSGGNAGSNGIVANSVLV